LRNSNSKFENPLRTSKQKFENPLRNSKNKLEPKENKKKFLKTNKFEEALNQIITDDFQ